MAEKLSTQIEFLVALQDLDIMQREIEEVKALGFEVNAEGAATLNRAREDLATNFVNWTMVAGACLECGEALEHVNEECSGSAGWVEHTEGLQCVTYAAREV